MSIINRMLQELDRRQGMADPDGTVAMPQVRTVATARKDREWFWRIVALLMVAAVGWVGWIAWQLQPRPQVATDQAFKAAESARRAPPPAVAVAPKPPAPAPEPAKALEVAKPAPDVQVPAESPAKPAAKAPGKEAAKAPAKPAAGKTPRAHVTLDVGVPPARILPGPAQSTGRVVKRDRVRSPEERAEAEFRRGVTLLNQARTGEAEESFAAALATHSGHVAARQALAALYLEHGRVDEARRLLQEGVALHPDNVRFAVVLARILIERKDYAAAIEVANGVRPPEQGDAELQFMRATALQRSGRNAEAAEAFQASLRGAPQNGAAWMGLAIALEAVGRKAEAGAAFKRAAAAGSLGVEARGYAEQRARELQ
jgi:MSHA biogenesis protein MshN